MVLSSLSGMPFLMASLLYGAGLRLMEGVRLRVKDLDFAYHQITVRDGKGAQDRVTMLPGSLAEPLQRHLAKVKLLREGRDPDRLLVGHEDPRVAEGGALLDQLLHVEEVDPLERRVQLRALRLRTDDGDRPEARVVAPLPNHVGNPLVTPEQRYLIDKMTE